MRTSRRNGGYTARSSLDTVSGRKNALMKYMREGVIDTLNKRLVMEFRIPRKKAITLARNYVEKLERNELERAHRDGVDLNELIENSRKKRELAERARREKEEREAAERRKQEEGRERLSNSRRGDSRSNNNVVGNASKKQQKSFGRNKGGKVQTGKNVWTAIAEYNIKLAKDQEIAERKELLERRKNFNQTLAQQVAGKRRIVEREKRVQARSRKLVDDDFAAFEKEEALKKKKLHDIAIREKQMRDQQMVEKRKREEEWVQQKEEYGKKFIAKCLRELKEEQDAALREKQRKAQKNVELKLELDVQMKAREKEKERLAEEEKRLAREYIEMVNAKEEARREEYRQRKARIKAKCDAMGDVYDGIAERAAQEAASTQSSYEKHLKKRAAELQARKDLAKRRTIEQMNWLDRMMREKNEKKLRQYQEDMRMARKMQMDADQFFKEQRDEELQRKKMQRQFRNTLNAQIKERSLMPAIDEEPDILLLNKSLLKTVEKAGVEMGDTIQNLPDTTERFIKIRGQGKERRNKLAAKKLPAI